MNEYGYYAKTVAEQLNISPNTLRRWSIELEKQGYQIERNDKNNRIYYERDYRAFRELKKLLDAGVSMESAVKTTVNTVLTSNYNSITPSVYEQKDENSNRYLMRYQDEEQMKQLLEEVMAQVAVTTINPLISELHEAKQELIEQRKENQLLKETLQKIISEAEIEKVTLKQELKAIIENTNKIEKHLDQQANKSFLQRLFKK